MTELMHLAKEIGEPIMFNQAGKLLLCRMGQWIYWKDAFLLSQELTYKLNADGNYEFAGVRGRRKDAGGATT